jgi:hypothetical protein
MGVVVGLNGNQPSVLGEPRSELIGVLENILERAKAGQIQSFIGAGFCSDGSRISVWSDSHENVYEMLGSLAWLEHEYVSRHTEPTKG